MTSVRVNRCRELAEWLVLAMAVAAPWMFGSVDAWAELVLEVGAGVAVVLTALSGSLRWRNVVSLPGLALLGLLALAVVQASPLPGGVVAVVDPASAALRAALLPDRPERVVGDAAAPVSLPAPTISQAPGETLDAAARVLATWLLFQAAMGVGLGGGYPGLRRLAWVLALNATVLSLVGIVQMFAGNGKLLWVVSPPYETRTAVGPFVCHTHFAEVLNLGLGCALGLLLGQARDRGALHRSSRLWALYPVGMIVVGVVASLSRGGFVGMLAVAAVMAAGLWSRPSRVWAGLSAGVVVAAVVMAAMGDVETYRERLGTLTDLGDEGYSSRLTLWGEALGAWRAHPLLGTGLGTFNLASAPYFRLDRGLVYQHAESEYVENLVEGGLIGLGLCLMGVVGVARRTAWASVRAPSAGDRALVLGAGAGVAALLVQFVSDFGFHLAGVAVPLVVVCGRLVALGTPRPAGAVASSSSSSSSSSPAPALAGWPARLGSAVVLALLAGLVVRHGWREARVERWLIDARVPLEGEPPLTVDDLRRDLGLLSTMRSALARAIELRPEWAVGHLQLGLIDLALYRATADEWLSAEITDFAQRDELADPLHLLDVAATGPPARAAVAELGPVRRHLVPAARGFLEARRASLVLPLAHAGLGGLSFLLEPGDAGPHVARVLRTAGADAQALRYAAEIAARSGDLALAASCWRRGLRVSSRSWTGVADAAASYLDPETILRDVVPADRGHLALWIADRLYTAPAHRATRERFLRHAIDRLPADTGLPQAERHHAQAQAQAALGDRGPASSAMKAALALEPDRYLWRKELVGWLLEWGDPDEAHSQALVAAHLAPGSADAEALIRLTADAVARGRAGPAETDP